MTLYLAIKIVDLVATGTWRQLLAGTWESWLYVTELLAAAGLVFFYVVENYSIFDDDWKRRRKARGEFMSRFDRASGVWQRAPGSDARHLHSLP